MTVTSPAADAAVREHAELIDSLIPAALPHCATLADLLPRMSGAGPVDVIEGLRRATADPSIGPVAAALLEARTGDQPSAVASHDSLLPLPHPLDSEWRFAEPSVAAIIDQLLAATAPGDTLLLVGTPSVALGLGGTTADRRFCFVGPDDAITAAVRHRLSEDQRLVKYGQGIASAALFDPPWYRGPFREMAATCAEGVAPGGRIFTVQPREATRPGMRADLADMFRDASVLGLVPDDSASLEVAYSVPLFELAALERHGLPNVLGDWRRGDLVSLSRQARPSLPQEVSAPAWPHVELTLDGCRIRLTLGADRPGAPLEAVEPHEVSRSISARSPTRGSANVWTSTNRAFRADERACLAALCRIAGDEGVVLPEALARRRIDSERRIEVENDVNMIHRLRELFVREVADASRLLGEGSWLRGARGMRYSSGSASTYRPGPRGEIRSDGSSMAGLAP